MTTLKKMGTRYVAPPMFEGACLAQTVYLRDLIGDAFHHYVMKYDGVRMDSIRADDDLVRLKPLMFAYAYSPEFENNIERCGEQIEMFKKDMTNVDAFARVYCHTVVPYFLTNTWVDEIDGDKKEKIIEISTTYRTMIDALIEPFYQATAHVPVRPSFIFYSGKYIEGSWEDFLKDNGFEYVEEEVKNIKELKGTVAYKGNVKGIAKIILSPNDFHKLNEGDILVAPMTTPLYVPIMYKAAGIVTDEGGVTCHAAIIAREMKKPCIIGTKIATKVIGNGCHVNVDAENGIIKIESINSDNKMTKYEKLTLGTAIFSAVTLGSFAGLTWLTASDQKNIQEQQYVGDNYPSLHLEYSDKEDLLKLTNIGQRPVTISCFTMTKPVFTDLGTGKVNSSWDITLANYGKTNSLIMPSQSINVSDSKISRVVSFKVPTLHRYDLNFNVIGPTGIKFRIPFVFEMETQDTKVVRSSAEAQPVVQEKDFSISCAPKF